MRGGAFFDALFSYFWSHRRLLGVGCHDLSLSRVTHMLRELEVIPQIFIFPRNLVVPVVGGGGGVEADAAAEE